MLGLLSDLPRENCWTIAERVGETSPHAKQHLLSRAAWDADAVRGDVRECVVEHLHDEAAVLVVDETGDVKPRLRRQAGTPGGGPGAVHPAVLDVRPGYRAAGLGEDAVFATKPELARTMIERSWTPETTWAGSPGMRSTAATRNCGRLWKSAASATSPQWSARPKFPPEVTSSGQSAWSSGYRSRPGRRCPPGRGAPPGILPGCGLMCGRVRPHCPRRPYEVAPCGREEQESFHVR